jgi:hypothetical protein
MPGSGTRDKPRRTPLPTLRRRARLRPAGRVLQFPADHRGPHASFPLLVPAARGLAPAQARISKSLISARLLGSFGFCITKTGRRPPPVPAGHPREVVPRQLGQGGRLAGAGAGCAELASIAHLRILFQHCARGSGGSWRFCRSRTPGRSSARCGVAASKSQGARADRRHAQAPGRPQRHAGGIASHGAHRDQLGLPRQLPTSVSRPTPFSWPAQEASTGSRIFGPISGSGGRPRDKASRTPSTPAAAARWSRTS